jgi:hypothetical protein
MALPNRRSYYFVGIDEHIFAYADTTNIYITWKSVIPYLQETFYANDSISSFIGRTYWSIGNYSENAANGALRFNNMNVTKTESISSASLEISIDVKGSGSSNVKMITYGIDEDNTGDFGSDPFPRNKTSVYTSQEQSIATPPFNFSINILSMFNEIRQRSGWSPNNNMGFNTFDNNSPIDSYLRGTGSESKLIIQRSGSTSYSFRILVFKDKIA